MSGAVEEREPWEALLDYVGEGSVDHGFVQDCWEQAVALVDRFIGSASVPQPVLNGAYIQTGSELYARRNAPSGITGFSDGSDNPIRLARDPMTSVYPILRRFVSRGFA